MEKQLHHQEQRQLQRQSHVVDVVGVSVGVGVGVGVGIGVGLTKCAESFFFNTTARSSLNYFCPFLISKRTKLKKSGQLQLLSHFVKHL